MRIRVLGITDITCEGCGGTTRLTPDHVYRVPEDLACNCYAPMKEVDLTTGTISATIDEVLLGLANGADINDFDDNAKDLYAVYIVDKFEEEVAEGVPHNTNEQELYAASLDHLQNIKEDEDPEADVDLTTLSKKDLKLICVDLGIEVPNRATNDDIIKLILTAQG